MERNTVPNEQENGWTQQLVWMDLKKRNFLALLDKKILKHQLHKTSYESILLPYLE
jgi:hypothetical protein